MADVVLAHRALHKLWEAGYFNCPGEEIEQATAIVESETGCVRMLRALREIVNSTVTPVGIREIAETAIQKVTKA